jgi:hypothetical protein
MQTTSMEDSRVAVVVVHGVADQQSGDSVRSVSNLLLNLDEDGAPLYRQFRRVPFRIQSRPVRLADPASDCRGNAFARFVRGAIYRGAPDGAEPAHRAFLRAQLECYQGETPDHPYESIRLEALRKDSPARQVHLYEMYWADLSRLGRGVLRVFGELYQILLHVPSVGVQTLRAALLEHPHDRKWRAFTDAQNFAAWLLNVPIALVNLLLLAIALTVAIGGSLAKLPAGGQAGVLWIALTAAVAWQVCTRLYRRRVQASLGLLGAIVFLVGFAGAVLAHLYGERIPPGIVSSVSVSGLAAACLVGVSLVVKSYEKRRPSALRWWWVLLAAALGLLVSSGIMRPPLAPQPAAEVAARHIAWLWLLRSVEVGFIITEFLWAIFYAAAAVAHVLGSIAVAKADNKGRRARWTARLTLSTSAVAFTFVTLAVWAGITSAFTPLIPDPLAPHSPMQVESWQFGHAVPATRLGTDLVVEASLLVPLKGVFAIFALVIAIVGLIPVVLAEASPGRSAKGGAAESARMGHWLTLSNNSAFWAGWSLYATVAIVIPLVLVSSALARWLLPDYQPVLQVNSVLQKFASDLMAWLGGAVAGSAIGLFALARNLNALSGFLAPIDIVLDVDNYMREHPRNSNPTARIFGRYVSLLRSICLWRDPESNQPYDALIIVAHSQGTVITADLLRFLRAEWREASQSAEYDPELLPVLSGRMPVYLLTMGSPLRNLYGRRFPHLYGWAFHDVSTPMSRHASPDLVPDRNPDPRELGVRLWVNAFRSGDYIGRFLWRSDACDYAWLPPQADPPDTKRPWDVSRDRTVNVSTDAGSRRREICIGAGAHTHYWDETAPEIAFELDRLIDHASRKRGSSARDSARDESPALS